jgi:transposase
LNDASRRNDRRGDAQAKAEIERSSEIKARLASDRIIRAIKQATGLGAKNGPTLRVAGSVPSFI